MKTERAARTTRVERNFMTVCCEKECKEEEDVVVKKKKVGRALLYSIGKGGTDDQRA